jgi:hypothetical protein
MDRERFDALARLFAVKHSRRTALGVLVTTALVRHDPDAGGADRPGKTSTRVAQSSNICAGNGATGGTCPLATGGTGTCCNGSCAECCGTDVSRCPHPQCQQCSTAGICENVLTTATGGLPSCTVQAASGPQAGLCCSGTCCPLGTHLDANDREYTCGCYSFAEDDAAVAPCLRDYGGLNLVNCVSDADCLASESCQEFAPGQRLCHVRPCANGDGCPDGAVCVGNVCYSRCEAAA